MGQNRITHAMTTTIRISSSVTGAPEPLGGLAGAMGLTAAKASENLDLVIETDDLGGGTPTTGDVLVFVTNAIDAIVPAWNRVDEEPLISAEIVDEPDEEPEPDEPTNTAVQDDVDISAAEAALKGDPWQPEGAPVDYDEAAEEPKPESKTLEGWIADLRTREYPVVTTVEEVDAYPHGSLFIDRDGDTATKAYVRRWLPARVIYVPAEEQN